MTYEIDDMTTEEKLVQAIYSARLFETCMDLEADTRTARNEASQKLIEQAANTCQNISRDVGAKQSGLVDALIASGLTASANPKVTNNTGLQYHDFQIQVVGKQLDQVLAVLSAQGFAVDLHLTRKWKAVEAAASSLHLTAWDECSTRVKISWQEPIRTPLNKLEPNATDFAIAPIPTFLWPLYYAVKPVRFFSEWITGQRFADRLGLKSGSFSLGTPPALLDGLFDLAEIKEDDTLVDLGCGEGRVIVEAAKRRGCKAIGVERNATLVEEARRKIAAENLEANVEVYHGSAKEFDLSSATVVFLFLPKVLVKEFLNTIFERGRSGTRVVAHEQHQLSTGRLTDKTVPIFADNALTVGHLWTVR